MLNNHQADTIRVIYAIHPIIPDPRSPALPYHTARGTKSIYLKEPKFKNPRVSNDVQFFDFFAPNVSSNVSS